MDRLPFENNFADVLEHVLRAAERREDIDQPDLLARFPIRSGEVAGDIGVREISGSDSNFTRIG